LATTFLGVGARGMSAGALNSLRAIAFAKAESAPGAAAPGPLLRPESSACWQFM